MMKRILGYCCFMILTNALLAESIWYHANKIPFVCVRLSDFIHYMNAGWLDVPGHLKISDEFITEIQMNFLREKFRLQEILTLSANNFS